MTNPSYLTASPVPRSPRSEPETVTAASAVARAGAATLPEPRREYHELRLIANTSLAEGTARKSSKPI
jgi:hypothetical protein